MDFGEQCDNGKREGCTRCIIEDGYECPGTAKNICFKIGLCGDGILSEMETCDNGNKPGCINCVVSNGYTC